MDLGWEFWGHAYYASAWELGLKNQANHEYVILENSLSYVISLDLSYLVQTWKIWQLFSSKLLHLSPRACHRVPWKKNPKTIWAYFHLFSHICFLKIPFLLSTFLIDIEFSHRFMTYMHSKKYSNISEEIKLFQQCLKGG